MYFEALLLDVYMFIIFMSSLSVLNVPSNSSFFVHSNISFPEV